MRDVLQGQLVHVVFVKQRETDRSVLEVDVRMINLRTMTMKQHETKRKRANSTRARLRLTKKNSAEKRILLLAYGYGWSSAELILFHKLQKSNCKSVGASALFERSWKYGQRGIALE